MMIHTKREITDALRANTMNFLSAADKFSPTTYIHQPQGKWSVGQHQEHLLKSIKPLNFAFSLPGFVPVLLFGKPSGKPMNYEEVKHCYQNKLSEGAKASGAYVPKTVAYSEKQNLDAALKSQMEKLCVRIEKLNEQDLDKMLLPHPILGKITAREMLFFTIYHTEHHTKSILT